MYKLKADAPNDAVDTLAKSAIVPMMEKMLANGTIVEYEIDTEADPHAAPGTFYHLLSHAQRGWHRQDECRLA